MKRRRDQATADQIAALVARVHPPTPPSAPLLTKTCRHCGVHGECDPSTVVWVQGVDGTQTTFGVCADCAQYDDRARAVHALHLVLGTSETDEAVQGIPVTSFADRSSTRGGAVNRGPWGHLNADRERLADEVQRNRQEIAERTGGPCAYCGVTRTAPGTQWVQPAPGAALMCGGCASSFSDFDGRWKPVEQRRSIAAGSLLSLSRNVFRLGENVGLLFWSESGRTPPNAKRWGHVDMMSLYRRALDYCSPSDWTREQYARIVQIVVAADAAKLTPADRATIMVELAASVPGDGTRRRLRHQFGVSQAVIDYVDAHDPVPA